MRKVAVITGSSRGIGAATAIRLAADGYDICVNYLLHHDAANDVAEQAKSFGANVICVKADTSNEAQVRELFKTIDSELGNVSALVNNAAILAPQCRVVEMDASRINQIFSTNITGYFLCCKEGIKRMSTRCGGAGGVIVNVSSAAARIGAAGEYVDYAASKGAVDTLTVGLANEVAEEGIRVNGVRPGFIYTQMHAAGGEPGRVDRVKGSLPLKRGGTPEEVAASIAWLLSNESSYTTGSFIDVSGGR